MKADVADWDERQTHRRREGSINAFFSWFIKASLTASMGIGGMVLAVSGFDAALDRQPDEVVLRMFWIYLLLPMVIWCGALVAVWAYPLDRGISGEIRRQLEERRGKI
jgi:GPH family glycoside/pentoside/hexuronide:cation symporter